MSEEYRTVIVVVRQLRINSIMLTKPRSDGIVDRHDTDGWMSCPRSCLHGGDDLRIAKLQHDLPQELAIRMMAWKADELHLA